MICNLFVPKKFIGSWILSKFIFEDTSRTFRVYEKFSIDYLKPKVNNILTTQLITNCYNQLLNQINNNKTEFVNEVKAHFKINSLADISDDQREHFLGCFNYFALKKLDNYIKDNLFQKVKSNLKQQFCDCFTEFENYEVCQQLIEEYFATDRVDDMIEIVCKRETYNLIFTKDNKNDFMEFIRKYILEEKKIDVMPLDSPKLKTIENQEAINPFQNKS